MVKQLTAPSYQVFLPDGTKLEANDQLEGRARACEFLEAGGVIFFPRSPFRRSAADGQFLLSQNQTDDRYHKNIAYRPGQDRITGAKKYSQEDATRLQDILREFSQQSDELVNTFLSPYAGGYKKDFASYRPLEERGRKLRLRARNDLIHVDSFPTRPTRGDRIFRVFENVNPSQVRVWRCSDPFDQLVRQFKDHRPAPGDMSRVGHTWLPPFLMRALGLKLSSGSPYDSWMNGFHNFLKENESFQTNCRKATWEFPPGSAWMVFTDMVSHSVLSGQFALEQTYIVSQHSMVLPEKAPINILRQVYG